MNTPRLQSVRLLAIALLSVVGAAQAGQGLLGEYYSDIRFAGPAVNRVDSTVDFDFNATPGSLPAGMTINGGVIQDTISIRWTGEVLSTTAGVYNFECASDDGSRLWVNGVLLVNTNWRDQGETGVGGNITLAANTRYSIRMEGYQGNGGVSFRLRWTPPAGTKVIIPAANLFPASQTQIGGGSLQMTTATSPANVNLTLEGDRDWALWGDAGAVTPNIKSGGGNLINDFARQGVAGDAVTTSVGTTTFSWTNGTPTATNAGTQAGVIQAGPAGAGFEITLPANTTNQMVRIYLRVNSGNVAIEAKLSDFSTPIATTSLSTGDQVLTIRFKAASANQMLTVRAITGTGSPILNAVTLIDQPPVALPGTFNTVEDTPFGFDLDQGPNPLASDPEGNALTFPAGGATAQGGTVAINTTTGVATYTPPLNFAGTDTFSYIVSANGKTSAAALLTFIVAPVNDGPPVLVNDAGSTPDGTPLIIAVLANDTVIDAPLTVTIASQPAHGTAVVNANNTITYTPTVGYVGPDSFLYRVTDADGQQATATVNIAVTAIPPTITSVLSVSAIQGLLFTYKITATGTLPITYTAAPLPSGLTLVGDTIQGFIQAGSYAVTLSATNSAASDIRTLVINAIVQTPNADTDGDGFPDELEIAVGSSPVDPNSTPFTVLRNGVGAIPPGIPPPGTIAVAKPFFVSNLGIKLDFRSATLTRDAVSFKGTLPVPSTFSSSIQAVAASVGGVTVSGVLDTRGSYTSANKRVKVKIGKTRTSLAGANAPISVSTRGVFAGAFTDEGYSNVNASKAQSKVVLFVIAGTEYFTATVNTDYSAVAGQKGSAKSSKR